MWALSKSNSLERAGHKWTYDLSSELDCFPDYSDVVVLRTRMGTLQSTYSEIKQELACMLRAPWKVFQLHITKSDGTFVTESDFESWYTGAGFTTHDAIDTKPSDFIATNPTWTHEGETYSTDIFSALSYEDRNMVEIELEPCFLVMDEEGNTQSYPAAQELFFVEQSLESYGLTAVGGNDVYNKGWESRYRIRLDAESETFEDDLTGMASFIKQFATRGIRIPYSFKTLPDTTGHTRITLVLNFTVTVCSMITDRHTKYRIPLDRLYTEGRLDQTSHSLIDWKSLVDRYGGRFGSCFRFTYTNDDVSDPIYVAMDNFITRVYALFNAMSEAFYTTKGALSAHPEIHTNLDKVATLLDDGRSYLNQVDNRAKVHTDGILNMDDAVTLLKRIRAQLLAANIGDDVVFTNLEDALGWDRTLNTATSRGIWEEGYRQRDRPIYVDEEEQLEQLSKDMADIQERRTNPTFPMWSRILLIILGAAAVTGTMIVLWMMFRKD